MFALITSCVRSEAGGYVKLLVSEIDGKGLRCEVMNILYFHGCEASLTPSSMQSVPVELHILLGNERTSDQWWSVIYLIDIGAEDSR